MCLKIIKEKVLENENILPLLKWIAFNGLLCAVCLSHIYTIPIFAKINKKSSFFNITLHNSYETEFDLKCELEEPFCGLIWVKLVPFCGFAASQFSMGFLADRFGPYNFLRPLVKLLIFSGIAATLANTIYFFCFMWFWVAFASTAVYLLTVTQVLEKLDEHIEDWKWRLIIGCAFQNAWTVGRILSNITVYAFNDWITVMTFLTIAIILVLFIFEDKIFNPQFTPREAFEDSFEEFRHSGNVTYLNIILLSLTWFALGYNYYGNMNNWRHLDVRGKDFEHKILMTILALLAKILALSICFAVRRKCFPMAILQIVMAVCYLIMVSMDPQTIDKLNYNSLSTPINGLVFLAHLTSMWGTASFELIWVITPETFPKKYRITCNGICSGVARLGAITGIIVGEMKILNESPVVLTLAGALIMISAFLIKIIPDMTKHKMPNTIQDVLLVQFPERFNENDTAQNAQ